MVNSKSSLDFSIRKYRPEDSIDELTELLHRSYKQLADMGLKFLATYQSPETTKERIERGTCFVAVHDKRLIGILNYYPPCKKDIDGWIESSWMGQFAVEPTLQGKGVGGKMVTYVEQFAKENGNKTIALDTAESATHLIDWYKRLGYNFHSYISWDITNYRSIVLIKELS